MVFLKKNPQSLFSKDPIVIIGNLYKGQSKSKLSLGVILIIILFKEATFGINY